MFNDPLFDLIAVIGKMSSDALDRSEKLLNDSVTILRNMTSPAFDDDGFELPHLDPEDDPETRKQMEAEEAKHPPEPIDLNEVPF